jgi:hypothetical protein
MCKLEQFSDHSLIEFHVFGFLNKDPKVSLMKTFWCKCSQNVCQPDIITTLKQYCSLIKRSSLHKIGNKFAPKMFYEIKSCSLPGLLLSLFCNHLISVSNLQKSVCILGCLK